MAKIDLPLFESRTDIRTALDVAYRSNRRAMVIRDGGDDRLITAGALIKAQATTGAVSLADIWDESEPLARKAAKLAPREFRKRTVSGDVFADFGMGKEPLHARIWHEVSDRAEILRMVGGAVRCYCDGDDDISCDPEQLVDGTCPGCNTGSDCG